MTDLHVHDATPADAAAVLALIEAAFGARQHLDPPSTAPQETAASVAAALAEHGGLLARVDGRPAGALLFERQGDRLRLHRLSVDPPLEYRKVASALVGCAEQVAAARGCRAVSLTVRTDLPGTHRFWTRRCYVEVTRDAHAVTLAKPLPVELVADTAEATRAVGVRLSRLLRAGDLVLLSGDLGAGKTTLTQGIGAGLEVRGAVASPTFVIARVHPALRDDGPDLVHVDAYRLGGLEELDDLDLDAVLDRSVTVVEWGAGMAEQLSPDRLEVVLTRRHGDEPPASRRETEPADPRRLKVVPVGRRWLDAELGTLGPAPSPTGH
ncbi:MAG: tRNA (adenosine(37)-N6)-threonylcarbamoyltransferase complex ATPase subunit type 1 TsaE [Actinomycetota bacterium]|nr:tRNA (adenosine(37)-N6)-threonylcarbamoyltransferase complex ATPase subunit type 1 TsaE [Actinomycetota bacterium]